MDQVSRLNDNTVTIHFPLQSCCISKHKSDRDQALGQMQEYSKNSTYCSSIVDLTHLRICLDEANRGFWLTEGL